MCHIEVYDEKFNPDGDMDITFASRSRFYKRLSRDTFINNEGEIMHTNKIYDKERK